MINKIALCFCVWKRTELERIVIDYYKSIQDQYNFDICIVGSEGIKSQSIASGCNYIEHTNKPVSDKHNQLAKMAKGYKGAILIGSDDLIEPKLFDYYHSLEDSENTYYGFPDVYYWQPKQNRISYWDGIFMGAGRYFPKSVLEKTNFTLWSSGLNKGLDTSCRTLLDTKKIKISQRSLNELDAVIIDVKGFGSISSEGIVQAGIAQDSEILNRFPKWVIDRIKQLPSLSSE